MSDYKVGYGKPPIKTQIKPGERRNPYGRRGKRPKPVVEGTALMRRWIFVSASDDAGIRRTYVSDIECGARNPTITVVERLAVALGVSAAELLGSILLGAASGGVRLMPMFVPRPLLELE
jgi:hypothetical protein